MAIEVEHKFLLANNDWRQHIQQSIKYRQGYLSSIPNCSVRIRISDHQAWINIKSATIGNQRHEYEYQIPQGDANEILDNLCRKPLIEKTRHFITDHNHVWEIDEFEGANKGLIVAEIELETSDTPFTKPSWVGKEVTHDLRYYNNNLALYPYSEW